MIKISELQAILTKANQLLGDAPVIFKTVEGEVETAFHAIEVSITSTDPAEPGTVTVVHGPAQPAPPADPASEQAAGTAPAGPSA